MREIHLVEHSPQWSKDFIKESSRLKDIIADNLVTAFHIGSTAIVGLRAKPVIDILLVVRSLTDVDQHNLTLQDLGYVAKGEYGIQGRRFFLKGGVVRTHHLHLFEMGNSEIERHKLFVEFLNAHPDRATQYEMLKIKLASKYKLEPDKYTEGKSAFIQAIDVEALAWKKRMAI